MLINKKYNNGDVLTFKLSTGEELIGKLSEETTEYFMVNKPTLFGRGPNGIGLVPALMTADINKDVPLNKAHVMMHSPAIKEVWDLYIETTTGIQPVARGEIIV